jgi:hypothetical protein
MPVLRDLAVSQYFATVEDPWIDRTSVGRYLRRG